MTLLEKINGVKNLLERRFGRRFFGSALATLALLFGGIDNTFSQPSVEARKDFVEHSGVNLPWGYNHSGNYSRYGWDIGKNPWGGADEGFSVKKTDLDSDFASLKAKNVKMCRVFLFCDFRTGLTYDGSKNITGIDSKVNADMQALIDVANKYQIKLVPVLMDYTLADGTTVGSNNMGEHPDFITNTVKRTQLWNNVLKPFVKKFGTNDILYCWDIMNEPRMSVESGVVSLDWMKRFLDYLANGIKKESTNKVVTIGHYDRFQLNEYGNTNCTITQVHYYDHMSWYWNFNTPASTISTNMPVFLGEVEPTNPEYKMGCALSNDYKGILFWSWHDSVSGRNFSTIAHSYSNYISSVIQSINKELRFISVETKNQNLELKLYPTYPENTYYVDRKTKLASGSWQSFTNFRGKSETNTVTLSIPLNSTSFFYKARATF